MTSIYIINNKVSINETINRCNDNDIICLEPGIYNEKVRISMYWFLGGRYSIIINASYIDIISLIMLILGSLIVENQGILVDVKNKLIVEKKSLLNDQSISFDIKDEDINILNEIKNK